MAPEDDFNHVLIAQGAKQIADAGGSVQLGAHGQLQGLGAHWELWMLQQGGMTPMEALRAATIDGARYLGLDGELGSLEKGKLADLIVLDRNPLENIRNSESLGMVMLNGRLYDAKTLNENRQPPAAAAAVLVGVCRPLESAGLMGNGRWEKWRMERLPFHSHRPSSIFHLPSHLPSSIRPALFSGLLSHRGSDTVAR